MNFRDWAGIVALFLVSIIVLVPVYNITFVQPDTKGPQYKCIEGYKFTKNGKTQIISETGGGVKCSDNFVLPNTLGVR